MVSRIKMLEGLKQVLGYNEKKFGRGTADLIVAENFLKPLHKLSYQDKWMRFEKLIVRNDRALNKAIHISLNFHPSEKERLNKEFLGEITREYMRRIGFEDQPYLVYQHFDAGHPHVHIVSTLIGPDGFSLCNSGNFRLSNLQRVSREVESMYELVVAQKKQSLNDLEHTGEEKKLGSQKLTYGEDATTLGIQNVLEFVTSHYKFTSLQELNAVLRQYNVLADRTHEKSFVYQHRGLLYRILNEKGIAIGVPVKASSLEGKPTLSRLEQKFLENEQKRQPEMRRFKVAIDWTLVKLQKSLKEFVSDLAQERVVAMVDRDSEGRPGGFTYVDHQTGAVFSEAFLGKQYSAIGILERLGIIQSTAKHLELGNEPGNFKTQQRPDFEQDNENKNKNLLSQQLEMILTPENTNEAKTHELSRENGLKQERKLSREF
jgi:Relaxase/Mobilisation nuclease domain